MVEEVDGFALFFCGGRRLAKYPEHARRAVESGFYLGNHTYSRTRASELSVEAFEREVVRTEALLEDVYDRAGVPRPARVFRLPYGDEGGNRADRFQRVLETEGFVSPCPERVGDGISPNGYD